MTRRYLWALVVGVVAKAQGLAGISCVVNAKGELECPAGTPIRPGAAPPPTDDRAEVTITCKPESSAACNDMAKYHMLKVKPKNGECPVCHEMAPRYILSEYIPAGYRSTGCNPLHLVICTTGLVPYTVSDVPTSRRIDCDHCGNTFKQFAEDVKQ